MWCAPNAERPASGAVARAGCRSRRPFRAGHRAPGARLGRFALGAIIAEREPVRLFGGGRMFHVKHPPAPKSVPSAAGQRGVGEAARMRRRAAPRPAKSRFRHRSDTAAREIPHGSDADSTRLRHGWATDAFQHGCANGLTRFRQRADRDPTRVQHESNTNVAWGRAAVCADGRSAPDGRRACGFVRPDVSRETSGRCPPAGTGAPARPPSACARRRSGVSTRIRHGSNAVPSRKDIRSHTKPTRRLAMCGPWRRRAVSYTAPTQLQHGSNTALTPSRHRANTALSCEGRRIVAAMPIAAEPVGAVFGFST